MRKLNGKFLEGNLIADAGLTIEIVRNAIQYTHQILDQIDDKLLAVGADRMSQTVELANLSSMAGNLLGAGIARLSDGKFRRNGPHKYPDILANSTTVKDIEIKISLEKNIPKGHLAKAGYYLTCRYVLVNESFNFNPDKRGEIVEIWEARFGYLEEKQFNLSNTPGDSGKTAVINKEGMDQLKVIYVNLGICPYTKSSSTFKNYEKLIQ
jgi:hypothetical protein